MIRSIRTVLAALPIMAAAFSGAEARVQSTRVEVPVKQVFVPARGFDDNDTVEAVLDGELPNSCYTLEKSQVDVDNARRQIRIRQFATRVNAGTCGDSSSTSPLMTTPVPFTDTVTLGQLSMGTYTIVWDAGQGRRGMRSFSVDRAPVATADTLSYASVSGIQVSDVLRSGVRHTIEVTGILNNSCYELNERVQLEKVGDVYVVLPTVRVDQSSPCLMYIRPFTVSVDLGAVAPGRYLIHVRSRHGKSVNRVFTARPEGM